jgi:threonine dehydrogenase-like Zn-dependent dehydrogenase
MGSAAEFKALCEFLTSKKVSLDGLVDTVFKGLESADEAFEKMKNGSQFGTYNIRMLLANMQGNW